MDILSEYCWANVSNQAVAKRNDTFSSSNHQLVDKKVYLALQAFVRMALFSLTD